jgi:alpha-beta hydrolase superfamily lysophospholipase
MKNETGSFEGRENRILFYQYWLPEGDTKAYIIIMHGWGMHSDRMKYPAEFLTEKGYAVYSFDIRGHWRNAGEFPGHIDSMDHLQKDIVLFMDVVKNKAGDKKIFIMGHSFGALIVLTYAINHPFIPGILVSSPLLGFAKEFTAGTKLAKKFSSSIAKLAPTKTIEMIFDQKNLTGDLKILREYIADKHKTEVISIKSIAEMTQSMKWVLKNAINLICPLFIMQAGNDKIADKELSKKFYNNVSGKDKTYKEYPDLLHEVWNERSRAQVYQDMYIWLEKHL